MWLIGVSILIGILLGGMTAYLLVTFEQKWYKYITMVIGTGGTSRIMILIHNNYGANDFSSKQKFDFFLLLSLITTFLIVLAILIHFIKVENTEDVGVIRTRDIILGRKDYIETYYNARKRQIDEKLNLPALEKREKVIQLRENAADEYEKYLKDQFEKLKNSSKNKLCLTLPDKKIILLNQAFIDQTPSFMDGFSQCINSMRLYLQSIKEKTEVMDLETLQVALTNICVSVMTFLFGNSTQVRTHFRKYNDSTKQYELFVGIEGNKFIDTLTPIPYEESMIGQSDICHQALIKSLNAGATKYNGNNNTIWKDYMTYAFYNLRHEDRPIISFGISVKNEKRYRDQFYFLNYAKFENYLNSSLVELNRITSIESVLYLYGEEANEGN